MNANRQIARALATLVFTTMFSFCFAADAKKYPAVGDTAQDFQLKALDGTQIELKKIAASGPVTLVVLRGYPGYQCPLCTKQVSSFLSHAADFKAAGTNVILVYPGAAADLEKHGAEFLKSFKIEAPFVLVTDPDYTFTSAYSLRWNAPRETAYPSTFVISKELKVTYAKVSMSHGDRAEVADVLAAVKAAK